MWVFEMDCCHYWVQVFPLQCRTPLKVSNKLRPVTDRTRIQESAAMLFMEATFQIPSLKKTTLLRQACNRANTVS